MNPLHVIPVDDIVDHDLTDDCICGPSQEAIVDDDGSIDWLVCHHSLDGRELWESKGIP